MSRITKRFDKLKADKRAGLVIYISAGDPTAEVGYEILKGLPAAGADLIELGMPFTDPMADGPSVQVAGQRALKAGMTVDGTFDMVRRFRKETGDNDTPILLMGYYNLVYQRGAERFCKEAAAAGVDGFILVDLPPEEADELKPHAEAHGLDTVLLTAPTTDDKRLPAVLKYSAGFVYLPRKRSPRMSRASSATPSCRWALASASRRPSRPRPWLVTPMPPSSVLPSSIA